MNYYLDAIKKYFEFRGRASRKAYWMFVLVHVIIVIILSILDNTFNLATKDGSGLLASTYGLLVALPSIALGVRRMHDSNHKGWWMLLPIVNFIMMFFRGTKGDNKYGPEPLEAKV